MKFLHTSDWQIGMKALRCGDAAPKIREARLEAGKTVVKKARENGAECILVAGDLFEDNAIDRSLVRKTAAILRAFQGPVFILPGNHDPLTPGSVWDDPAWALSDNITILREPSPVQIPGGMLFPCPALAKHSMDDPTGWISPDIHGRTIRVGLAHGSVASLKLEDMEYPIPVNAAERSGLDYLALGHWHSKHLFSDANEVTRIAYSGTHETTGFDERNSGYALVVEISEPESPPRTTPVRTGGLTWRTVSKEILVPKDMENLKKDLEATVTPGRTILDLTLSGLLHPDMQEELEGITDMVKSTFLFGQTKVNLRPSPIDDSWVHDLPPGVIRGAAERLWKMATDPGPRDNPGVATRALLELYSISHEVKK